jgi:mono/diheme cytochrome c family protein
MGCQVWQRADTRSKSCGEGMKIAMRCLTKMCMWAFVLAVAAPSCVYAQIQPPPVDPASAERGGLIFQQSCSQCHGSDARGALSGPDLIRSLVVLHDRAQQLHGSELAPLLKKPPSHNFDLTDAQVADISQFLTRAINRTLRSGYSNQPTNMLSGNAKAGEAYFNGAGGCSKCHSPTGDLAGIAKRYDPAAMQQRFVFPGSGRGRGPDGPTQPAKSKVTVTPPAGQPITGTLVRIDDFNVSLLDASGQVHRWTRVPGMKVEVDDPYAAHIALLDKYTDTEIHNMTAYLETLK